MDTLSRKEFLQRLALFGLGAAGASAVLTACGGGGNETASKPAAQAAPQAAAPAADPCGNLEGLTEAEVNMRGTFKYVAMSPEAEKHCANCALYIVPAEGAECGGCQIIKGSINPKGWCMQWVAKPA
jgi:hypothetical protein